MDAIFHERQEGSLCAQHCLNALLQGSYFTAVDLAELGRQLDERERATMAEAGVLTEEYRRFSEQPSGNYDDSGFFSIQVLENALEVWNLILRPLKSSDDLAVTARQDPRTQIAYICNFKEHWFCIRKLGNQWFNLNSLLTGPELVSDTYLQLLLKQLETEGYSIFIVVGDLPESEADQLLKLCPAVQPIKPSLITDSINKDGANTSVDSQFSGDDLQRALEESKQLLDSEDPTLQEALKMSMQGIEFEPGGHSDFRSVNADIPSTSSADTNTAPPSAEELRQKRLAFLNKVEQNSDSVTTKNSEKSTAIEKRPSEMTEEEMLKAALAMSMESKEIT